MAGHSSPRFFPAHTDPDFLHYIFGGDHIDPGSGYVGKDNVAYMYRCFYADFSDAFHTFHNFVFWNFLFCSYGNSFVSSIFCSYGGCYCPGRIQDFSPGVVLASFACVSADIENLSVVQTDGNCTAQRAGYARQIFCFQFSSSSARIVIIFTPGCVSNNSFFIVRLSISPGAMIFFFLSITFSRSKYTHRE